MDSLQDLQKQKKDLQKKNPGSPERGVLSPDSPAPASPDPNSPDPNSLAALKEVDRLIHYVSQKIELLAFDELDATELEQLIAQLIESLADPRKAQRIQLIDALAHVGEPATPLLLKALAHHPDSVVRRACCHALSQIGDETAVVALVAALQDDQDMSVKSSAAGALARIGAAAFESLRSLLAADTASESCKGHAAWAMASMSHEVVEKLYAHVNDPSPAVRIAVIGAIAQVAQKQIAQKQTAQCEDETIVEPDAQPLSLLIQSLDDSAPDVRIEAIAHLARLNCQPACMSLVSCLQDTQWEVRKAAILALGKLEMAPLESPESRLEPLQTSVIETLNRLKQDPVAAVQQAATFVVGQLDTAGRSPN